jgi:hypothetical protein
MGLSGPWKTMKIGIGGDDEDDEVPLMGFMQHEKVREVWLVPVAQSGRSLFLLVPWG